MDPSILQLLQSNPQLLTQLAEQQAGAAANQGLANSLNPPAPPAPEDPQGSAQTSLLTALSGLNNQLASRQQQQNMLPVNRPVLNSMQAVNNGTQGLVNNIMTQPSLQVGIPGHDDPGQVQLASMIQALTPTPSTGLLQSNPWAYWGQMGNQQRQLSAIANQADMNYLMHQGSGADQQQAQNAMNIGQMGALQSLVKGMPQQQLNDPSLLAELGKNVGTTSAADLQMLGNKYKAMGDLQGKVIDAQLALQKARIDTAGELAKQNAANLGQIGAAQASAQGTVDAAKLNNGIPLGNNVGGVEGLPKEQRDKIIEQQTQMGDAYNSLQALAQRFTPANTGNKWWQGAGRDAYLDEYTGAINKARESVWGKGNAPVFDGTASAIPLHSNYQAEAGAVKNNIVDAMADIKLKQDLYNQMVSHPEFAKSGIQPGTKSFGELITAIQSKVPPGQVNVIKRQIYHDNKNLQPAGYIDPLDQASYTNQPAIRAATAALKAKGYSDAQINQVVQQEINNALQSPIGGVGDQNG